MTIGDKVALGIGLTLGVICAGAVIGLEMQMVKPAGWLILVPCLATAAYVMILAPFTKYAD